MVQLKISLRTLPLLTSLGATLSCSLVVVGAWRICGHSMSALSRKPFLQWRHLLSLLLGMRSIALCPTLFRICVHPLLRLLWSFCCLMSKNGFCVLIRCMTTSRRDWLANRCKRSICSKHYVISCLFLAGILRFKTNSLRFCVNSSM